MKSVRSFVRHVTPSLTLPPPRRTFNSITLGGVVGYPFHRY